MTSTCPSMISLAHHNLQSSHAKNSPEKALAINQQTPAKDVCMRNFQTYVHAGGGGIFCCGIVFNAPDQRYRQYLQYFQHQEKLAQFYSKGAKPVACAASCSNGNHVPREQIPSKCQSSSTSATGLHSVEAPQLGLWLRTGSQLYLGCLPQRI